jgi:hypothetical protein
VDRLALPFGDLKERYDVVIVGSSYGEGGGRHRRVVLPGYGHFEARFGSTSAQVSCPHIVDHLVRAGA